MIQCLRRLSRYRDQQTIVAKKIHAEHPDQAETASEKDPLKLPKTGLARASVGGVAAENCLDDQTNHRGGPRHGYGYQCQTVRPLSQ